MSKTYAANSETGVYFSVAEIDGVTFYYTLDGSTPTSSSTRYDGEVTLTAPNSDEKETITIKVIGIKEGAIDSEIATATVTYAAKLTTQYTLTLTGENITADPAPGSIDENTLVTVTVTPAEGQQVATFNVNEVEKKSELVDGKYTFNITADTTVAVTYEAILNKDQDAPEGLVGVSPTSEAGSDGKITGVDDTMEYKLSTEDDWTSVSEGETEISDLAAGIYHVRYAAKTGYNPGMVAEVVVPEYVVPTHTVTFSVAEGNGTLIANVDGKTIDSGAEVEEGKIVIFSAFPAEGYQVKQWVVDGQPVAEEMGSNYTLPSLQSAKNVKVEFEEITYTVSFVDWDGVELKKETVEHGSSAKAPEDPVREGYTFTGWNVAFDNVIGDLTVTAQYEIDTYIVSFESNGGSTVEPQTVNHGETVTAPSPAPTKESYTFVGWYQDGSLETEFAFDTEITADTTIYANWEINKYTVTFNSKDGSEVESIENVEHNTTVTLPVEPTKEGFTFGGWFTDETFKNEFTGTTPVTADTTVYAKWTAEIYTVTFVDHDGTKLKEQAVEHGSAAIAPDEPEREGYTFNEWDVEFDNVIEDLTVTATYTINSYNLTYTAGENGSIEGETEQTVNYGSDGTEITAVADEGYTFVEWSDGIKTATRQDVNVDEDIMVSATFAINTYTVTFVDYDNTVIETVEVEHGSDATVPNEPTREGHTFIGWDIDFSNVTGDLTVTAQYKAIDYTLIVKYQYADGSEAVSSHTETLSMGVEYNVASPTITGHTPDQATVSGKMPAEDVTVTVVYNVNQYTITFNSAGGSDVDSIIQNYGTEVVASADPTKEGYTFAGWNPAVPETMPANDLEVTAQWTINEYTVTFVDWDDQVIEAQTVEHGTSATAPSDPAREGYTFVGWYADEALETEFDFDTEITANTTIYAKWEINSYTVSFGVTPEDATVVVTDSEDNEIAAEEDGSYKLKPGNYTYIVDAEGYITKEASLTVDTTDQSITVELEPLIVIGDETVGELYIVNRDYTDNSVISDDIGPVTINIGNQDVTQSFDFAFYDQDGGNEITNFDLSEGATTFRVFMEATSQDYNDVSANVVFKYRSVTIGDNEEYYTIEDALAEADSGTVYVKYNTSFADVDVAEEVYNSTEFTIKSGVTLLLPYSDALSAGINDNPGGGNTGGRLNRDSAYVELTIPTDIKLSINGILTVNAMNASISTRFNGHVTGSNYAQLHLKEDSTIFIQKSGTLNSNGFVYGEGTINALSGSKIYEPMFVKSFRGGTATSRVYSNVFPFDQYTVNNIEVDMIIDSGASYTAKALIYASSSYTTGEVKLVGNQNGYLLKLNEGRIIKAYDQITGRVSFEILGSADINNTSIRVGGITAGSENRDFPFDGTWNITVASGSNLTINSWVMLLPGASVKIESGANVTISKNGKITVFDPYEYLDDYSVYPVNAEAYYRIAPAFDFNSETLANFTVNGDLSVNGGLAGRVHVGESGSIDLAESASTTFEIKYVSGTQSSAAVYSRDVKYIEVGESPIIHASPKSAKSGETVNVVATITDADGNPLEGKAVEFRGGTGVWSATMGATDSKGKVRVTYTIGDNDSGSITLSVEELDNNKTDSVALEIKSTGGGSTCLADGTLITLSDGSQKPVEELTGDELLLVWNLHSGTFDIAPITFIDSDPLAEYEIIHLHFSDGTDVKVIYEHGFWDFNLNEYIYINGDNPQQYIGHWFNKQITDADGNLAWTKVQLVDVVFKYEYTRAWSPVTYEHLSYYTNGMLSMPGGIEGVFNIFEVSPDTIKIDQNAYLADIEEYGLFTYEEFAQLINVPEEMFDAFQAQYFKVAIGKEYITIEDLLALVLHYGELLGLE